jgi:uncharacterized coiled-coil DUF342 family protein
MLLLAEKIKLLAKILNHKLKLTDLISRSIELRSNLIHILQTVAQLLLQSISFHQQLFKRGVLNSWLDIRCRRGATLLAA